ncbi:hypothetical protein NL676_034520 [Syzygium grande]|nr:hypothetical protein NL676_034520 [Syzygium grande]
MEARSPGQVRRNYLPRLAQKVAMVPKHKKFLGKLEEVPSSEWTLAVPPSELSKWLHSIDIVWTTSSCRCLRLLFAPPVFRETSHYPASSISFSTSPASGVVTKSRYSPFLRRVSRLAALAKGFDCTDSAIRYRWRICSKVHLTGSNAMWKPEAESPEIQMRVRLRIRSASPARRMLQLIASRPGGKQLLFGIPLAAFDTPWT